MKNLVAWFLFLLALKQSTADGGNTEKPTDNKATETENVAKTVKQPEKRGTVRVAVIPGAVGQQNYNYRIVYPNQQPVQYVQQQQQSYSQQQPQYTNQPSQYTNPSQYKQPPQYSQYTNDQYSYANQAQTENYPKLATTVSTPKYEFVKYTPPPQQLILPTPYPTHYPAPAMLLVLAQPNPSGPYTFMLLPQHGFPQYNYLQNHYPTGQSYVPPLFEPHQRVAYVLPQYVAPKSSPYNNYLSQNAGFAAAQQLLYGNQKETYQEEARKEGQTTQSPDTQPSYGNRVRPLEQYNKG